eukprot:2404329-Prymnesium_polylepis.1
MSRPGFSHARTHRSAHRHTQLQRVSRVARESGSAGVAAYDASRSRAFSRDASRAARRLPHAMRGLTVLDASLRSGSTTELRAASSASCCSRYAASEERSDMQVRDGRGVGGM